MLPAKGCWLVVRDRELWPVGQVITETDDDEQPARRLVIASSKIDEDGQYMVKLVPFSQFN